MYRLAIEPVRKACRVGVALRLRSTKPVVHFCFSTGLSCYFCCVFCSSTSSQSLPLLSGPNRGDLPGLDHIKNLLTEESLSQPSFNITFSCQEGLSLQHSTFHCPSTAFLFRTPVAVYPINLLPWIFYTSVKCPPEQFSWTFYTSHTPLNF